ncbi:MAG: ATP-binding protein [Gammaproteobacteria bacterium]|nr:ATP-binding protein [Gammaproteobacteria bacterium]
MQRHAYIEKIKKCFQVNPICAILGPRQCGKTSLALAFAKNQASLFHHFDLENHRHAKILQENPLLTLEELDGLIILDEIQRVPNLFVTLRYLVDHYQKKILILGSAHRDLIQQSSESLAGRISYLELTPFTLTEVIDQYPKIDRHFTFGGFPKAFLQNDFKLAHFWLESFIQTFIERDLGCLGFNINHGHMRHLWFLLAHYHGQLVSYTEIGGQVGISHTTVKKYIELLAGTFVVRILRPFHQNITKRQIKSPKVYIRDSGVCMHLLDMTERSLIGHPKLGALWEGYALEEIIRFLEVRDENCYFWRTEHGAELDLLLMIQGKKIGFEFKYSDVASLTRSMRASVDDLQLDHLYVITPKGIHYNLDAKIFCYGLKEFFVFAKDFFFE